MTRPSFPKHHILALALVAIVAGACKPSPVRPPADAGPDLDAAVIPGGAAGLIDAFARFDCVQLLTCDQREDTPYRPLLGSLEECTAMFRAVIDTEYDLFGYIERGTVLVDTVALGACIDAVAAHPCISPDFVPECDVVLKGTVAVGGGCSEGYECTSAVCSAVDDQCGTCVASVGVGEPCNLAADDCRPMSAGYAHCVANVGGTGASCVLETSTYTVVGLGASCASSGDAVVLCESPYYCNDVDVCAERTPAGSTCEGLLDECVLGTTCADGPGGMTCAAPIVVSTVGAPCGAIASGVMARCDHAAGLYCNADTAGDPECAELGNGGGAASLCLTASDCDAGFVCVIDDFIDEPGFCVANAKAASSACDVDIECASLRCISDPVTFEGSCVDVPVCP
jgi:hypothetical protein